MLKKKKYTRFYFILFIISYIIFLNFFASVTIVYGSSMSPTLEHNQITIVRRWFDEIEPGQIVVTNADNLYNQSLIKRVFATEGQIVYYNENTCTMEYSSNLDSCIVSDKSVFLLGDNIDRSNDSRNIGSIPKEDIIGVVVLIIR